MKCPVCKTHNDDGAEMCSRCGASLTEHQTEETSSKKRSSISIAHIILRIFLVVFYGGLLIIFGGRMIKKTVGSEESNPSYDITAENMEPVGWQQVKEDIDQNRETIEADTKERLDELQQQINIISAQEEAISPYLGPTNLSGITEDAYLGIGAIFIAYSDNPIHHLREVRIQRRLAISCKGEDIGGNTFLL